MRGTAFRISLLQGFLRPSVSGVWHSSLTLCFIYLPSAEVADNKHITEMKTFTMKWLPIFLLVTIGLVFSSCEANEPDDEAGVITLKMRNWSNGKTSIELMYHRLYIGTDNNFFSSADAPMVCDVGKKKLSVVKTIPTTGWAKEVAVTPGHSYVIRDYEDPWLGDLGQQKYYWKLYVVNYIKGTSDGIIGAEVKYCEWTPEQ